MAGEKGQLAHVYRDSSGGLAGRAAAGRYYLFAFRSTFAMLFITMVLMFAGLIGIKKTNFCPSRKENTAKLRRWGQSRRGKGRQSGLFYAAEVPVISVLNSIRDHNFRELRDLMVGFYALNNFEIYPNAFVKRTKRSAI